MSELPPAVIDTKVCTVADPNGTKSRIYTQFVTATPLPPRKDEGLGPIEFKSAKFTGKVGTGEVDINIDENGKVDWDANAKLKPSENNEGKKKIKLKLNAEVCVKKKYGRKDGKGSSFTLEWQAFGVHNKAGFPDGDWCVGVGKDYVTPDVSIEPGSSGE